MVAGSGLAWLLGPSLTGLPGRGPECGLLFTSPAPLEAAIDWRLVRSPGVRPALQQVFAPTNPVYRCSSRRRNRALVDWRVRPEKRGGRPQATLRIGATAFLWGRPQRAAGAAPPSAKSGLED